MLAIIGDRYGSMDVLERRETASPTIGAKEVLVRVRAAALHPGDVFGVTGSPFPVRAATGMRRPKYGVPGLDLAGEVVKVGAGVTRVQVGDSVFGEGFGTAAQYARAAEDRLAPMPERISVEQAAALPTSGLAALHGLRDAGRLQSGHRLLINGASGGVGTFAIQIAKAMGVHVTAVTSTANVELVESLGADRVIDYTREDFTADRAMYDVIFDNIENRELSELRRALKPNGTLVLNSGTGASGMRMLVRLIKPLLISVFVRQRLTRFLSTVKHADLMQLRAWVESGQVRPVVERCYPLEETPAALRHIAGGHARGKLVIAVGDSGRDAARGGRGPGVGGVGGIGRAVADRVTEERHPSGGCERRAARAIVDIAG